jgi:tryptophanyl-tRNA synthetase
MSPERLAAEIGGQGSGALKSAVTDAVNDRFASIRARRRELAGDPGYLAEVLADGNERTQAVARVTLTAVRAMMHTSYEVPR